MWKYCLYRYRPCPKCHTSCALTLLWTYNGHRVCVSVKSTRPLGVSFVILGFRPFAATICALDAHFRVWKLCSRHLPDSQSGIVWFGGRLWVFGKPFWTGPYFDVANTSKKITKGHRVHDSSCPKHEIAYMERFKLNHKPTWLALLSVACVV